MKLLQRTHAILKRLPPGPCRMAEVGVWIGALSEQILRRHDGVSLLMVDRWASVPEGHRYRESGSAVALRTDTEFDAAYGEALSRTEFAGVRRTVLRGESVEIARGITDASCDLVFLDDDHSYGGVWEGLDAWLPKVKHLGWIAGHDWGHPDQGDVERAVTEYRAEHGITSRIELGGHRTWFWRVR